MHSATIISIFSIFVCIVVLTIFLEYRNEKKYQAERLQARQRRTSSKGITPPEEPKVVTPKPTRVPKPEPVAEVKPEPEIIEKSKSEPKTEVPAETKELPEANYPQFTHVRLIEMGLSDEEAKEFVDELIPQIETEIPLIEAAIQEGDFHKIEKLTHGIKGSANNLGTGGVSDLLTDYNTYLKTGTDSDIATAYFKHLIHYSNQLKAQYA